MLVAPGHAVKDRSECKQSSTDHRYTHTSSANATGRLPAVELTPSPSPSPSSAHPPSATAAAVSMLELQLPHPMPHAVPRDSPFDFYSPSRSIPKMDAARQMQLPMPHHGLESLRTARRPPITPPSDILDSAVRVASLPPAGGAGHDFGYQLPAIGSSRTVTARTSPTPQRQAPPQAQQPAQDMSQRKKWTISPNLRIPSTISTPQEGLPQLAAEVSFDFEMPWQS